MPKRVYYRALLGTSRRSPRPLIVWGWETPSPYLTPNYHTFGACHSADLGECCRTAGNRFGGCCITAGDRFGGCCVTAGAFWVDWHFKSDINYVRSTDRRKNGFCVTLKFDFNVLAQRCNCIASSAIAIKCRLSATRVYCDKTAEARIMQFSINVAQCINSLPFKFDYEIQRESPRSGAQTMTSRCCISRSV